MTSDSGLGQCSGMTPERETTIRSMETQKWFAVRCFFLIEAGGITSDRGQMYEERITIWQAESAEGAMAKRRQRRIVTRPGGRPRSGSNT